MRAVGEMRVVRLIVYRAVNISGWTFAVKGTIVPIGTEINPTRFVKICGQPHQVGKQSACHADDLEPSTRTRPWTRHSMYFGAKGTRALAPRPDRGDGHQSPQPLRGLRQQGVAASARRSTATSRGPPPTCARHSSSRRPEPSPNRYSTARSRCSPIRRIRPAAWRCKVHSLAATQPLAIREELSARRKALELEIRRRFQKARVAGDLPQDADPAALASYTCALIHGMAVQAAGGASRKDLKRVARAGAHRVARIEVSN